MFFQFSVRSRLFGCDSLVVRFNLYEYLPDRTVFLFEFYPDVDEVLCRLPVNRVRPVEFVSLTVLYGAQRVLVLDRNRFWSPSYDVRVPVTPVIESQFPRTSVDVRLWQALLRVVLRDIVSLMELHLLASDCTVTSLVILVEFCHSNQSQETFPS